MDVIQYLRRLFGRWRVIVATILVCTAAAITATALATREYQTSASFFVSSASVSSDIGAQQAAAVYAQQQVYSYAAVASSEVMANAIKDDLRLSMSSTALRNEISTSVDIGTVLITITVTDTSPDRAVEIMQSLARTYNSVIHKVDTANSTKNKNVPTVTVTLLTNPERPDSPSSPHATLNVIVGIVAGLLLGIGLAALREVLDNRIKDAESLSARAKKPTMGVIIDDPKASRHPIATRAGRRNIRAENFRQLRANMQFANVDSHPRVIAVASSIPTEGKTMVAMNLASTLAEAGFTVCLVDADLRRPSVANALGLSGSVGLTSVLINQISLADALQSGGVNFSVLCSGPTPPNPSEVLASAFVREVIRSLLDLVDYVIIDTAPLLPVADGSEVAALADGTLLVARHKLTTDTHITRSIAALDRVDATLLGVVLNRVPNKRTKGGYGYGYYGRDETPRSVGSGSADDD